jgi:type IV secretion system protein VirB10
VPAGGALVTAPPPLALPPRFLAPATDEAFGQAQPAPRRPVEAPVAPPAARYVQLPAPPSSPDPVYTPPTFLPQPSIVEAPAAREPAADGDRVFAGRLPNPSLTVPQGAVIPAVLETALDSTQPGAARAIVQRDVMGFDGTRVLIPRGSRLYGEYGADLSSGQKRALIRWTRLTRPDAVIVRLDSPAADPLGRGGVEGKVNSHFLSRFGGAILQSILDIGVGAATRSVSDNGVILALPGSTQNITGNQREVRPTLKVRQGTSVSVFVARDLDFSTVES